MDPMVLVTYATRRGSTEEVAQAIAEALREGGLAVEVLPLKEVRSLTNYSAVALAAALYMFRLHKDARRFISKNRAALMKVPVTLFVPGPVHEDEKEWTGAREQLNKELTKMPWFKPVAHHVVGGKFDPAKLGFPFSWIPAMRRMPASDARDWAKIRAMAKEFGGALHPAAR
jgi:menaquinone-dependent protoporphyrinogen oxidase